VSTVQLFCHKEKELKSDHESDFEVAFKKDRAEILDTSAVGDGGEETGVTIHKASRKLSRREKEERWNQNKVIKREDAHVPQAQKNPGHSLISS
jgi:hypothetical protein